MSVEGHDAVRSFLSQTHGGDCAKAVTWTTGECRRASARPGGHPARCPRRGRPLSEGTWGPAGGPDRGSGSRRPVTAQRLHGWPCGALARPALGTLGGSRLSALHLLGRRVLTGVSCTSPVSTHTPFPWVQRPRPAVPGLVSGLWAPGWLTIPLSLGPCAGHPVSRQSLHPEKTQRSPFIL